MTITLIRVVAVYVLVIFSVRLMGKRQIGELQAAELVITILLSEIAAMPIQDPGVPLIVPVASVLTLAAFEVISSALSLKSSKFRQTVQGNSMMVIRNGKVDLAQLRRLRLSIDDLTESLRLKDCFDIADVQYAILESNGELSVLLMPDKRPVTVADIGISAHDSGIPCTVIYDGKIVRDEFGECGMTDDKLDKILRDRGLSVKAVMLMTADRDGKLSIVLQ